MIEILSSIDDFAIDDSQYRDELLDRFFINSKKIVRQHSEIGKLSGTQGSLLRLFS